MTKIETGEERGDKDRNGGRERGVTKIEKGARTGVGGGGGERRDNEETKGGGGVTNILMVGGWVGAEIETGWGD